MKQVQLFEKIDVPEARSRDIIFSVFYDRKKVMETILKLYCPRGIDVDLTFGEGRLWQGIESSRIPRIKIDKALGSRANIRADSTALPLPDKSAGAVLFDPPWMIHSATTGIMYKKYGQFDSVDALYNYLTPTIGEAARVLKTYGILIVKCQDFIKGRQSIFLHCDVLQMAQDAGFRPVDLLIYIASHRMIQWNFKKQQHVRKLHCYYWIFRKRRPEAVGLKMKGKDE